MANHVSHGSLPYPVKNARYTILVPYLDADGDPTDPTTPDTEVSQDGGSFADAAEEVTTITGSNGLGYITLTGAEMNNSLVGVAFKVASGPKATLMTLCPRVLPIILSGTASAGASGTITLAAGSYPLEGAIVRTTGGTGGGGTGGANNQARVITAYNTSTKVATVSPNWETTPDSTTTYDILLTDLAATVIQGNLTHLNGTAQTARDIGASVLLSNGTGTGQVKIASGYLAMTWADIAAPTTTVNLSGTTIGTLTTYTGNTVQTGDAYARLGAPAGASVSADVAAVKVDTAAIKTKTDSLTFTVAGMADANVVDWKGATAPAMTGDAFARLGAPAGASVSVDVAAVKSDTAAVKAKTDSLTFTSAGFVDANVQKINDVTITGDGQSGTEFGV
jgi:hypothetical protein